MIQIKNNSFPTARTPAPSDKYPRLNNRMRVNIGEVATSSEPCDMDTVLGSCVAVCLHDPVHRIGGMNHILLPGKNLNRVNTRYGIYAMELLINELMKRGADRKRMIAKAFGGACVIPGMQQMLIGDHNAQFVREFLLTERIPLVAQRLGGKQAVLVRFRTDTGKAIVHSVDGSYLPRVVSEEKSYEKAHLADVLYTGEITLF
ncbi:MAG: chemotaxis protein CheD [Terracidiphilus sp.]